MIVKVASSLARHQHCLLRSSRVGSFEGHPLNCRTRDNRVDRFQRHGSRKPHLDLWNEQFAECDLGYGSFVRDQLRPIRLVQEEQHLFTTEPRWMALEEVIVDLG